MTLSLWRGWGLAVCIFHTTVKDPLLPFLAVQNSCLQATPSQGHPCIKYPRKHRERIFARGCILAAADQDKPPSSLLHNANYVFYPSISVSWGIEKKGTEKSNAFARNIWNNTSGMSIKINVCRILLGFLTWRGPTVPQPRAEKCITGSLFARHSDRFQLSQEEQEENSDPGPDHRSTQTSIPPLTAAESCPQCTLLFLFPKNVNA